MNESYTTIPRIALSLGIVGALCIGCGSNDSNSGSVIERPLPSSLLDDDRPSMTARADEPAVATAPVVRAPDTPLHLQPEPEPTKSFRDLFRAGKKLSARGNHAEAIAELERALAIKPRSASTKIELARAYVSSGDATGARDYAEAAVEALPDSSYAWNTLGRVELLEGNLDAAIVSFRRATDENEDNSYAWNNLGLTLIKLARYEDAIEALERATSGARPTAYMWNNLGASYEQQDRIIEARAAYRQASVLGSSKGKASLARLAGVVTLVEVAEAPASESDIEAFDLVESDAGALEGE